MLSCFPNLGHYSASTKVDSPGSHFRCLFSCDRRSPSYSDSYSDSRSWETQWFEQTHVNWLVSWHTKTLIAVCTSAQHFWPSSFEWPILQSSLDGVRSMEVCVATASVDFSNYSSWTQPLSEQHMQLFKATAKLAASIPCRGRESQDRRVYAERIRNEVLLRYINRKIWYWYDMMCTHTCTLYIRIYIYIHVVYIYVYI